MRGVGSLLEICPPKSRYYELLPPETIEEAFAAYRANIEHYLGVATHAWEAEQEEEPTAASTESESPKSEEEEEETG